MHTSEYEIVRKVIEMQSVVSHGEKPEDFMRREREHWDNWSHDSFFWATKPRSMGPVWTFLNYYILHEISKLLHFRLNGKTIANVCCGSGMEAEYFSRLNSYVVGFDLSKGIIKCGMIRKRTNHLNVDFVVADAQCLPVKSRSFDVALAYSGLHHLPDPFKGLSEMARISQSGIILFEPFDAVITRISMRLGIIERLEPSGTEPFRFTEKDLRQLRDLKYNHIKFRRYIFPVPEVVSRFWDSRLILATFKLLFLIINKLIGFFGNRFILLASEEPTTNDIRDARA